MQCIKLHEARDEEKLESAARKQQQGMAQRDLAVRQLVIEPPLCDVLVDTLVKD
jgi:hypothetical protein